MSWPVKLSMTDSVCVNRSSVTLHPSASLTSIEMAQIVERIAAREPQYRLSLAKELIECGWIIDSGSSEGDFAESYAKTLNLIAVIVESDRTALLLYPAETRFGVINHQIQLSKEGEIINTWFEQ